MKSLSEKQRQRCWCILGPLVFAMAALLINDYRFGVDNQSITIPFLKNWLHPELYPGDYLLAERDYFYTFFWMAMAVVLKFTGLELPSLFGILHILSLYGLLLGVFLIARHVAGKAAGFVAMTFFLFAKPLWAGEKTLLNFLDTAGVARPLLLLAIYFFLRNQFFRSFFLQGLGFLIHPLTAFYGIAVIGVNWLSHWRTIGAKRMAQHVALLLAVAGPVVLWRFLHAPPQLPVGSPPPDWLALLHLRSAFHVFPMDWDAVVMWQSGLVVMAFLLLLRQRLFRWQGFALRGGAAILGMWIIGFIFTEIMPLTIVIQLQLFRSIFFLYVISVIYVAAVLVAACQQGEGSRRLLFGGMIAIALLYNARAWPMAVAALVLLTAAATWLSRREKMTNGFATAATGLAVILGTGAVWLRGGISLQNGPDAHWRDVQSWAQQHTPREAAFIVPPLWETQGFRVFSERTMYGDWKDGTQMFFNPDFGREWFRRMVRLGYPPGALAPDAHSPPDSLLKRGFLRLDEASLRKIAVEMRPATGPVYLVTFAGGKVGGFREVYQNRKYRVFMVSSGQ